MNSISKLFLFLLILSLSACIIKKPEEPTPPTMTNINVVVDKMTANKSCENSGTTGEADIYSKIVIYKKETLFSQLEVVSESEEVLVQLKRFESTNNTGIEHEVDLELKDGLIIYIALETSERDGGGAKQVEKTFSHTFIYEEDLECWLEDADECAFGTDPSTSSLFRAEESRMTDATCDVEYEWTTSIKNR